MEQIYTPSRQCRAGAFGPLSPDAVTLGRTGGPPPRVLTAFAPELWVHAVVALELLTGATTADLERLLVGLFRGRVVPEPQLREMFTLPHVTGARYGAGLERFEVNDKVVWGKTGARPGYATAIAATRDLSRTLVYSVNSTDAKDDGLPVAERFGFPAFNR